MQRTSVTDKISQDANRSYLLFRVAEDKYAIDILLVKEVLKSTRMQALAGAAQPVVGLVELRGNILSVYDLSAWLFNKKSSPSHLQRLIVLDDQSEGLCLLVDEVVEVSIINKEQIDNVPPMSLHSEVKKQKVSCIAHMGQGVIMLLNMDNLLSYTA